MKFKILPAARLGWFLVLICLSSVVVKIDAHPKRDHLTRQEADMVRDTQELDKRIAILINAADRRLLAISSPNAPKTPQSDVELLGELKGTRADFLFDLCRILDEAITNIDDVSGRDEKNPLIPKAVRKLAEASSRFLSQLAPLRDKVEEGSERKSLEQAMENAEAIVEAAGKLPPPSKNTKKKNGDK